MTGIASTDGTSMSGQLSVASALGRGIVASIIGTTVMTAFQKLVEMPITGRGESDAPAQFADKVAPVDPHEAMTHRQLNYVAHYGIGTLWGAAFGLAGRLGLRGQKAVHVVFPTVLTGDILLNTVLGLYKPSAWTAQDWTIDIVDKYVQAQATSMAHDRLSPA